MRHLIEGCATDNDKAPSTACRVSKILICTLSLTEVTESKRHEAAAVQSFSQSFSHPGAGR